MLEELGVPYTLSAAIRDYWHRLQSREGFRRALAAQEHAAQAQGVPLVAAPETGAAS